MATAIRMVMPFWIALTIAATVFCCSGCTTVAYKGEHGAEFDYATAGTNKELKYKRTAPDGTSVELSYGTATDNVLGQALLNLSAAVNRVVPGIAGAPLSYVTPDGRRIDWLKDREPPIRAMAPANDNACPVTGTLGPST